MKITSRCWYVFFQFMRRDFTIRQHRLVDNMVNYAFIYPLLFCLQSAYFQANIYFGSQNIERNTLLFAGNIVLILMVITYRQQIELLFDFENKRFIDYQIIVLHPFLVLLERIIFVGFYTFLMVVPFYPLSAYFFANYLDMSHTCWSQLFVLLFLSSCCLSAYHVLAACYLASSNNIASLWNRANNLMLSFGGFWIPWYVIHTYSPLLGYSIYLNPCIYITEGIKGAITQNSLFLPFWLCTTMLLLFTIGLTMAAWWAFKRRTDCV